MAGTVLFGLYVMLVYSYSRGRRVFFLTLSVLAGIMLIGAGAGIVKWKASQQKQLDFSTAIVLRAGTGHMEPGHSQSLVQETKYKFLPLRDGAVTIDLTPVGWDDRISGLYVYDSRKKRIFKRYGTVPSQVEISGAVSGEWIYVTVQTLTAYDVYRITIRQ